ncbi:hypothetical protein LRP52_48420 [Photobacterium sp. ZSDE20]|nr:hypothetical protein [Photobacterium sp. ZSDE20]
MSKQIELWIHQRAHIHKASGGKIHRKAQVNRIIRIMNEIAKHEKITHPEHLGKKHIHRYFYRHQDHSDSKIRDDYYALRILWTTFQQRPGEAPKCRLVKDALTRLTSKTKTALSDSIDS